MMTKVSTISLLPFLPLGASFHHTLRTRSVRNRTFRYARPVLTKERSFDPLELAAIDLPSNQGLSKDLHDGILLKPMQVAAAAATTLALTADKASAVNGIFMEGSMNPQNFQPVCPASDGLYRFLQSSTLSIVGKENFVEYGPLIAGGLLRVRLELCVVESFFNEAVGPFIAQNGLNWILPLHETVETFIAGTIFALASTFILIGSSKIVSVIITYTDFLVGFPSRLLGGFFFDRASGKPVTLDIGFGPFKTRLIGPPDESMKPIEFASATISQRFVLLLSGVVKLFGLVCGVSENRK